MNRLVLLLCLVAPLLAQLTDAQKEEFLRSAKIVRTTGTGVGSTQPRRATLSDGTITHDAGIQRINESAPVKRLPTGTEVNFRDYWGFNVTAYQLNRLLGLSMVPVTVERKFRRERASFSWWVDDVIMMELDRYQKNVAPPDLDAWNRQMNRVRVFNQLAYNTDPNLGNVRIDKDWKIWIIDYTRAFRTHGHLLTPEGLTVIDRKLLDSMRAMTPDSVKAATGNTLTRREQRALLERHDKIVQLFEDKIAVQGADAVLYDEPR
jgi:hypothetical protein